MKRCVNYAVTVMTLFYMAVAIAGYMAYGNDVAGNVLNSFVDPRWLVDMANIMVSRGFSEERATMWAGSARFRAARCLLAGRSFWAYCFPCCRAGDCW